MNQTRNNMDQALESDTEARKAGIDMLIALLCLRQACLVGLSDDHPHKEIIKQARESAKGELKWRMLSTVGLLDWWDLHPQYTVGRSAAGDWMGFDRDGHTCYAPTSHECLAKLQVMHDDLHGIKAGAI